MDPSSGGGTTVKKFSPNEILAIRVAVHAAGGAPQISKLEITEQESDIAQAAVANVGQCGLLEPTIDLSSLSQSAGQSKASGQTASQPKASAHTGEQAPAAVPESTAKPTGSTPAN
jgi:hypothetical protein